MSVAIIGGGFAGVAVAWHLLQLKPSLKVVLFDSKGIGGGASGTSVGLIHPYAGAHAKLNRLGYEGMSATHQLLAESSKWIGQTESSVYRQNGLLRVALTHEQEVCYQTSAAKYPNDIACLSPKETALKLSEIGLALEKPSIFIKSALEVNSLLYLQGLWAGCEKRGALLEKRGIERLEELQGFDITVVAAGGGCKLFTELANVPLFYTKGQVLEVEWPNTLLPLPCPVNSHVYVVMKEGNKSCLIGATYERNFLDAIPNREVAEADLLPKAFELIPQLADSKILETYAGIRVSAPDHMPLIRQFASNKWLITGLGSKGLLYHALFAKLLAGGAIG